MLPFPTNPLPSICREGFFPLQNAKPHKSFSTNSFLYLCFILFLFIYIICFEFSFLSFFSHKLEILPQSWKIIPQHLGRYNRRIDAPGWHSYTPLPRKPLWTPQKIVDCKVGLCTSLRTVVEFLYLILCESWIIQRQTVDLNKSNFAIDRLTNQQTISPASSVQKSVLSWSISISRILGPSPPLI